MIVTTMALAYFDHASRTKPWLEAFAAIDSTSISGALKLRIP
jgi:hypothetical protein